jgi:hypothetical protein
MTSSDERPKKDGALIDISVKTKEPHICEEPRKLSTSTDIDGPQEIRQSLPIGLEIKPAPYGFGIFATHFFPKESVLYIGQQIVIPNRYAEFRLIINGGSMEFLLNTDTHSVQFNETERWLYLFDSFMNHSDDPTTISRQSPDQKTRNMYRTVALKDIYPGDEITCDYNLFEYDCHGKVIEKCLCGSSKCVGRVAGYKFLSTSEQKARIQLVEQEVLESMSSDPSNKFYFISDLRCALGAVRIEQSADSDMDTFKMVATRSFKKGEVVYSNESLIFPEECSIVIEIDGRRKWLDNLVHTVNKGEGKREFYYFDSFQNHSCDPNTAMVYHSENTYDIVAIKDIQCGDEITSDYESFDEGLDGTSFSCGCGSSNCRGVIKA